MTARFSRADVRATYKFRDAWWTVLLVDPVAAPLVRFTANRTRITPNQLSVAALVLGFASAVLFWRADTWSLVAGAVVFYLAFLLDCMDGKIARLKGTGSLIGSWLDYVFDRIRVLVCALALFGGQYRETDDTVYLVLATVVVFLDMLRYVDALQIAKVRRTMNTQIELACVERGVDPAKWLRSNDDDPGEIVVVAAPSAAPGPDAPGESAEVPDTYVPTVAQTELQSTFSGRFRWFLSMRDLLLRHRIRSHVFSGIEFQMFVFVVAPLTTLVLPVTVFACVALLVFEAAIIYKLFLSMRDLDRIVAKIRAS